MDKLPCNHAPKYLARNADGAEWCLACEFADTAIPPDVARFVNAMGAFHRAPFESPEWDELGGDVHEAYSDLSPESLAACERALAGEDG